MKTRNNKLKSIEQVKLKFWYDMLESIHIINSESGISLFIKKYTSIPIKDDIIFVGFLKAMEDLSQETKNESIQEIILNESKIIFYKIPPIIVIGIIPKIDDS
ncbi:MAG: hypothetical protein ACFFDN_19090 [Candidatus Hodarchaeota archaeon]